MLLKDYCPRVPRLAGEWKEKNHYTVSKHLFPSMKMMLSYFKKSYLGEKKQFIQSQQFSKHYLQCTSDRSLTKKVLTLTALN